MLSIEDEREIVAVVTRYATAIDRRDWALFRRCFTEDIEADYGSFGKWRGVGEVLGFMEPGHAVLGPTLHRLSNIVVAGTGDSATARTYVDALLTSKEPGGETHRGIGYYDDELTRTREGWRIKRRRFTAVQLS